jgi:hypothetical protein
LVVKLVVVMVAAKKESGVLRPSERVGQQDKAGEHDQCR